MRSRGRRVNVSKLSCDRLYIALDQSEAARRKFPISLKSIGISLGFFLDSLLEDLSFDFLIDSSVELFDFGGAMKGAGALVASVAAASAVAVSVSSHHDDRYAGGKIHGCNDESTSGDDRDRASSRNSSSKDKFAPRFDGLRFIETLVTAHR